MRVALISPIFESVPPQYYGGTERVVFNLCRGLKRAKVDTVLFASGDSEVDCKVIPVISQALRLSPEPVLDPCAYHFKMLMDIREFAGEFDILHNHHDYWMLPLTEMCRVPVVSTMHGRTDLKITRELLQKFPKARFVSISDSQKNAIPNLPWIRTIYHGIDLDDFVFHEKPGNYLAFLGRISPEKRPDLAIQIALRAGVPLKIAAKIEGQEGYDYYNSFVKPYVDGRFIEYIGEISEKEKSEFLGNALAMVFPIEWPEPFGLVMIEALACGAPVLARPYGSVNEIMSDGITGYIEKDPEKLANRVQDVAKIDRKACRAWVENRFSLQRMTEDYIDVYRQVIKRRGTDSYRGDFVHSFERAANGNTED